MVARPEDDRGGGRADRAGNGSRISSPHPPSVIPFPGRQEPAASPPTRAPRAVSLSQGGQLWLERWITDIAATPDTSSSPWPPRSAENTTGLDELRVNLQWWLDPNKDLAAYLEFPVAAESTRPLKVFSETCRRTAANSRAWSAPKSVLAGSRARSSETLMAISFRILHLAICSNFGRSIH